MTMEHRYYCPECGDFKVDREKSLDADGFRNPILCKSCGTECTGLGEDPRMETLNNLAVEMAGARLNYQERIDAVTKLTAELKTDWGLTKLP